MKYICEVCKKEFNNKSGLMTHMTHFHHDVFILIKENEQIEYQKTRKVFCELCDHRSKDLRLLEVHVGKYHIENNKYNSKKEYYDNFLKKQDEGFCKICGKETNFISFKHGYNKFCCNNCKNSDIEVLKIRYLSREKRKEELKGRYPKDENERKQIQRPETPVEKRKNIIDPNRSFVCKICNKSYLRIQDLSCHLVKSHGYGKRDILKEYYLKYMSTDPEPVCITCGSQVKFASLTFGFRKYCSNKCFTKDPKSIEQRRLTRLNTMRDNDYEIKKHKKELKQYDKQKTFEYICEICGKKFETIKGLGCHLTRWEFNSDKNKLEKYYNKYLRKSNLEGICKTCGDKTKFITLDFGYLTYCNNACMCKDPEIQLKKERTSIKNFGVTNFSKTKEFREYLINGGAAYMLSFENNPSIPQCELHKRIKEIYPEAILNFPILNYSADIAIISLRLVIEYNGSYWHQKQENDELRKSKIEAVGWNVLTYEADENGRDIIPPLEQIKNDILRITNR